MTRIEGSGQTPYPKDISDTASKRVGYDPKTQKFKPLQTSPGKNTAHMKEVQNTIGHIRVPKGYSNQVLVKQAKPIERKGTHLTSSTKEVGKFVSGQGSSYKNFIASVSRAQREL